MPKRTKKAPAESWSIPELIRHKREGGRLTEAQLRFFIDRYTKGTLPDYQMAAWAMAVFFQGMTPKETSHYTLAMRDSGRVVDLSSVPGIKVDKHSTGGVGDKISLCLAPLVASCGVPVPMMAGRGLGHTGGTLDKLEAIPGFRIDLSVAEFRRQVKKIGCAIIGQTADLAPADKRLYALRDVTATIESVPLICGSILSKKLAEGIDGLVMDVKVGKGAFMEDYESAHVLAKSLVRVGRGAGLNVRALLTRMDEPLGRTIGNALETIEAFEVLLGGGPDDVVECTLALSAEMLLMGGVAKSKSDAMKQLERAIRDRKGVEMMERVVAAQGGDPRAVTEHDRLPKAKVRVKVEAPRGGYVRDIASRDLGLVGVTIGAGRSQTDDVVDPAVGIVIDRHVGEKVKKGDTIATLHLSSRRGAAAIAKRVADTYEIGRAAPSAQPLVLGAVRR